MRRLSFDKADVYWISNLCFFGVVLLAGLYFWRLTGSPSSDQKTGLLIQGVLLLLAAIVTVVLRAYYHNSRYRAVNQSASESVATAYAALGAERLKHITVRVMVSVEEQRNLIRTNELMLPPDRFTVPIRRDDTVEVCSITNGIEKTIVATIDQIDGYDQRIVLMRVSR